MTTFFAEVKSQDINQLAQVLTLIKDVVCKENPESLMDGFKRAELLKSKVIDKVDLKLEAISSEAQHSDQFLQSGCLHTIKNIRNLLVEVGKSLHYITSEYPCQNLDEISTEIDSIRSELAKVKFMYEEKPVDINSYIEATD